VHTNPWRLETVQRAIRDGKSVAFPKLMQMTQAEMYDPKMIGIHYAQAWSMVYFFWHCENGKYARLLQDYFRQLMKDEDMREAYKVAFGKQDMAKIEEEWRKFTLALRAK
jgi:hypothetical protein